MIEIFQAGQFGKTKTLIEMHKFRKLVFKDRMGWDIPITDDGLDIDEFDLPETVYMVVRDIQNRIVGTWRFTPTNGPSMIRDIWPEFTKNFEIPKTGNCWELSRFGVHTYDDDENGRIDQVSHVTATMITAMMETFTLVGIPYAYTLYHLPVGRSIRKVGFIPDLVSDRHTLDDKPAVAVRFPISNQDLARIRSITGIACGIKTEDLPPNLTTHMTFKNKERERIYIHG